MPRNITDAVREICLSFPETSEVRSHGMRDFRVRGKTFATYAVNHHGDERIALWLNAPQGAQALYTKEEPKYFFVPPYVGPRGWLGAHLDKGMSWKAVAKLVREAYENVAPAALAKSLGKTIEIKPPTASVPAEEFDPLQSKRGQAVLKGMRKICLAWPETRESRQFGFPVWKAGQKTFAWAFGGDSRVALAFWVGVERQGMYIADPRFRIPAYMGHNGWIELDVTRAANWQEVENLALDSYRHFALKRMLNALNEHA